MRCRHSLAAAATHRALLATMIFAGLRVGELCGLRWADVDLASGKLRISDAKTEAGERVVDVSPMLLDGLKLHRASSRFDQPHDFVFATIRGTMGTNGDQGSSPLLPLPTKKTRFRGFPKAAGQGFEPQLPDPESGVLPLDDPATGRRPL
jgi:integrase